jgi:hypothetical protein
VTLLDRQLVLSLLPVGVLRAEHHMPEALVQSYHSDAGCWPAILGSPDHEVTQFTIRAGAHEHEERMRVPWPLNSEVALCKLLVRHDRCVAIKQVSHTIACHLLLSRYAR